MEREPWSGNRRGLHGVRDLVVDMRHELRYMKGYVLGTRAHRLCAVGPSRGRGWFPLRRSKRLSQVVVLKIGSDASPDDILCYFYVYRLLLHVLCHFILTTVL